MEGNDAEVVSGLIAESAAMQIVIVEFLAALEDAVEGNAERLRSRLVDRIMELSPADRASRVGKILHRFERACEMISAP